MDKKTNPGALGSKGFIAVIVLCGAVLGASAWLLLSDSAQSEEATAERAVDISEAVVTMIPQNAAPTPVIIETEPEAEPVMAQEDISEEEPEPAAQPVFSEAVTGYVWPVRGEIEVPYSVETLLYDATMADWRTHGGVDIACELGTEVLAPAGGTVVNVWQDDLMGTCVEIDHANGVHSILCNLASEPPVGEGDVVAMGQIVGSVGQTALAEVNETPHLHFSMSLDGRSADPMDYLELTFMQEE